MNSLKFSNKNKMPTIFFTHKLIYADITSENHALNL
jgi:hypothetical protein